MNALDKTKAIDANRTERAVKKINLLVDARPRSNCSNFLQLLSRCAHVTVADCC
jgi:hypothetical protein